VATILVRRIVGTLLVRLSTVAHGLEDVEN
jgi:hypothetical protein